MKISLFTDDCEKPVNMLLYRRSKKEYVKAIEAAGLEVLEVSDRTLGELDALGVWRRKTRESFDKSSMNVMKLLGDCESLNRRFKDFERSEKEFQAFSTVKLKSFEFATTNEMIRTQS